ncbi:hypothetical protein D3Z36_06070 [Lachnospiraceae bacterium]|nr:hypothetical protein [Lachnospiraceae bacterium]
MQPAHAQRMRKTHSFSYYCTIVTVQGGVCNCVLGKIRGNLLLFLQNCYKIQVSVYLCIICQED